MFSLIVCSVDRFDPLERLFASLQRQVHPDFEVVLVDQNDDARLHPLITRFAGAFKIRHVTSERGLSRARNVGIAQAEGELIAFPDDDCWYEPETLATVAAVFHERPDLDIATGRTLDADGRPSVSPTGDKETEITRANYLVCGNSNGIFLRRSTMERIGGFDERLGVGAATPFQSGEEADLLLRAVALGERLVYIPRIVVHHDQVEDGPAKRQIARAGKYGAGFGALLRKHRFSFPEVAYRMLRPLAGGATALLRGRPAEARRKWAWFAGICRGYRGWKDN